MGQVRTGLRSSGKRLAQCSHVIVKVKKRFPMQVDGEPWEQPPGTVSILLFSLTKIILSMSMTYEESNGQLGILFIRTYYVRCTYMDLRYFA